MLQRIRDFAISNRSLLIFAAACFAAAFVMICTAGASTVTIANLRLYPYLFGPDALIVALTAMLCRGRYRLLSLAGLWAMALFLWANTMYFRYWGDIPAFSLIADSASYNSFVIAAMGRLLRPQDLIFLLMPAAASWLYRRLHVSSLPRLSTRVTLFSLAAYLVIFLLAQLRLSIADWRLAIQTNPDAADSFAQVNTIRFHSHARHIDDLNAWGLTPYTLVQIWNLFADGRITLTDDQRRDIARFISQAPPRYTANDSIFARNASHNVILLVVESLNSWVIDRQYGGQQATPTLNALLRTPGTIFCPDMLTQVKDGGSSDGQMMYNTGLLPVADGAAAMLYAGENTFHSLASQLGRRTAAELIVEDGATWNHRATSRAYGYSSLTECETLERRGQLTFSTSSDMTLMRQAATMLDTLPQPFFLQLVTLSMHYPFVHYDDRPYDRNAPWVDALTDIPSSERDYIGRCVDFDNALAYLVDTLRRLHIYDNTLLIIVSDHSQEVGTPGLDTPRTGVLAILNSGITQRLTHPIGQIDVFPTILDVTGAAPSARWRGLGSSALDPALTGATAPDGTTLGTLTPAAATRQRQAWQISDLILRGNYFATP